MFFSKHGFTKVWDRDIRLKNIKNAILSGKDATKEPMLISHSLPLTVPHPSTGYC